VSVLTLLIAGLLALLPLALEVALWRWIAQARSLALRNGVGITLAGLGAGALTAWLSRSVLQALELSLVVGPGTAVEALLAMFLLVAPLAEGVKLACVWPLVRWRVLDSPRLGVLYAVCAAAGFSAAETFARALWSEGDAVSFVRLALAIPAQLFFAALWGYALGAARGQRLRGFVFVWALAVLLHGLYGHIVFGWAAGLLVAVLPLALAMLLVTWVGARDIAPSSSVRSMRLSMLPSFEPPSVEEVRRALRRSNRPLMLHWIALGVLVNVGVLITSLVLAVWVARRMGVDFAAIDETYLGAGAPLVLLGAAGLSAFPFAGYLLARASAATSMLEPALAAALAIVLLVALLGMAVPVAVVFALGAAPIAFALACGGAWFGLAR
jgi:hypothetical protein